MKHGTARRIMSVKAPPSISFRMTTHGGLASTTTKEIWNMRILLIATAAVAFAGTPAMASGRAICPGAAATPNGPPKDIGIIATKSTDMQGTVFAPGATQCTIKFQDVHKTAPYCSVSSVVEYHISAKVRHTSSSEVTFAFEPSLLTEAFNYVCQFRD
jgi:hypothetical protein